MDPFRCLGLLDGGQEPRTLPQLPSEEKFRRGDGSVK